MQAHIAEIPAAIFTAPTLRAEVEQVRTGAASFRDRFAAQILDFVAVFILGSALFRWIAGIAVNRRYSGINASWESILLDPLAIWTAATIAIAATLLYFFLFECVAGRSLGKLACGLKVTSLANTRCGIVSALVRTVFRPVDTLLGPPFILLSRNGQRLGDRVAGTLVVKCSPPAQTVDAPELSASWEERTKAAIVDLAFLSMFAVAYCFATDALPDIGQFARSRPWLFIPLLQIVFLYFVVLEGIFGGTLGKLVCNLQVATVNSGTSRFASATIRALFYPVNLASFGVTAFLSMRFTPKRQHLGDLLAGALVISQAPPHRTRVWVTAAALSGIAAVAIYPLACRAALHLLGSH